MLAAAATYLRSFVSAWTSQITLFAIGGVLALIGALYLVSSAHSWLSIRYPEHVAGLIVAGCFLLAGVAIVFVAKIRGHKPAVTAGELATVAVASTIGSTAGSETNTSFPVRAGLALIKPALAMSGAGLLLLGRFLRPRETPHLIEILPPERGQPRSSAPLSTTDAAGALVGALGRNIKSGAVEASSRWRALEPDVMDAGRAAGDSLTAMGHRFLVPLIKAFQGRRRKAPFAGWVAFVTPRIFMSRRLPAIPRGGRGVVAYGLSIVVVLAAAAFLFKADEQEK